MFGAYLRLQAQGNPRERRRHWLSLGSSRTPARIGWGPYFEWHKAESDAGFRWEAKWLALQGQLNNLDWQVHLLTHKITKLRSHIVAEDRAQQEEQEHIIFGTMYLLKYYKQ